MRKTHRQLAIGLVIVATIALGACFIFRGLTGNQAASTVRYVDAYQNCFPRSLTVSRNHKILASASNTGIITFWSLPELKRQAELDLGNATRLFGFSEDGAALYVDGRGTGEFLAISTSDHSVRHIYTDIHENIERVIPLRDSETFLVHASISSLGGQANLPLASISPSGGIVKNPQSYISLQKTSHSLYLLQSSGKANARAAVISKRDLPGRVKSFSVSPNRRFIAVTTRTSAKKTSGQLMIMEMGGPVHTLPDFDGHRKLWDTRIAFTPDSNSLVVYRPGASLRTFTFSGPTGKWVKSPVDMITPATARRMMCFRDDGVLCLTGSMTSTFPKMTDTIDYYDASAKRFQPLATLDIGMTKGPYGGEGVECLAWVGPTRLIAGLRDGRFAIIDATDAEADLESSLCR